MIVLEVLGALVMVRVADKYCQCNSSKQEEELIAEQVIAFSITYY